MHITGWPLFAPFVLEHITGAGLFAPVLVRIIVSLSQSTEAHSLFSGLSVSHEEQLTLFVLPILESRESKSDEGKVRGKGAESSTEQDDKSKKRDKGKSDDRKSKDKSEESNIKGKPDDKKTKVKSDKKKTQAKSDKKVC